MERLVDWTIWLKFVPAARMAIERITWPKIMRKRPAYKSGKEMKGGSQGRVGKK